MKFVKGVIIGSVISAGIAMMYTESSSYNKKRIMKKGKQYMKKMGIM